jgi:hypothetical protein
MELAGLLDACLRVGFPSVGPRELNVPSNATTTQSLAVAIAGLFLCSPPRAVALPPEKSRREPVTATVRGPGNGLTGCDSLTAGAAHPVLPAAELCGRGREFGAPASGNGCPREGRGGFGRQSCCAFI